MENLDLVLSSEEKAVFALRALYGKYGYAQYKMSKFEEYDLYVKNKDFLVSDNIITFTDTDGKLMALKPDVTLSIIKNSKDLLEGLTKVYYNENVYRVSKGTKSFKELMQVGLECLGAVDRDAITEVLLLASLSLDKISDNYLLDISSLDVAKGIMDDAGISYQGEKEILSFLAEKNVQGVALVCDREGVSADKAEMIKKLVTVYGSPKKVMGELKALKVSDKTAAAISELDRVIDGITERGIVDKVNIDFSVVNNMKYYNGIVFKGFVEGIPTGLLSGGQYDKLMEKMGKKSRAIGFAVYLDELGKLERQVKMEKE
jgi:ATP phosphoribosyltransferase regulatory subunit